MIEFEFLEMKLDPTVELCRAMAAGLLDSEMLGLQTMEHMMHVSRTWDSILSLLPKGGETVWGNLDWSPEEGHVCDPATINYKGNNTDGIEAFQVQESTNYGPIVSFQNKVSHQLHSSHIFSLAF